MASNTCHETHHERDSQLATHRHDRPYAALVVEGEYTEVSAEGAFACSPGTLLLHPAFHLHGNRFGRHGARVVNVPMPQGIAVPDMRVLRVPHLREARDVFASDGRELADLIATSQFQAANDSPDWQVALLAALTRSDASVGALSQEVGVSAAHASRALQRTHGLGPQLLRRELRWRRALAKLHSEASLSSIALDCGFADQAHFTRVTQAFTGMTPGALRRQIKCVQDTTPGAAVS
ncbi:helix-turn-helix domain-containing protein [Lysobacter tyrosinilyticus]